MLIGQVLNSQATLNNFIKIATLNFVPEEQVILVVKIMNSQLDIRYIVENLAATGKFIFNKANNETEEVAIAFFTDDRSIVSATLSAAVTAEILGGNVVLEIDVAGDGSDIRKVFIQNALTKQLFGDC